MLYVVEGMVSNPRHPEKLQKVTIFLDSGAEQSFCSQDLAKKLQLDGPKENLRVSTFGSDKLMSVPSQLVKLGAKIFDGSYVIFDLKSIPYMIKPICTVLASEVDTHDKFLTPKMHQPDVLIGIDYYKDVVLSIKPTRMRSNFYLQSTIFGPTVGGRGYVSTIGNEESTEAENMVGIYCLATPHLEKGLEPSLEELVRTQYEIEKLGITEPTEKTNDDAQAVEILHKNIRIDESGRIEVPLLWRRDTTKVPMNRGLAYGRFLTEVKKLKAAGNLEKYDRIIKEYLELGIVEKVPDPSHAEGFVSYLPHHGITKASSSTTKLRIVNDGSATIGKTKSLNDHMYRGPPLIPDAAGFLMRFRKHILALIFDLEKAFLNLSVRKIDRDVLRFFWLIDINQPITADNIMILRYISLVFGFVCSPAILAFALGFLLGILVKNEPKHVQEVAKEIHENLYVDNGNLGGTEAEGLIDKYRSTKKIFAKVHINAREFLSNSAEVNKAIPEADRISSTTTKVLGINWNTLLDVFELKLVPPPEHMLLTKRKVLKAIARCYDPLGFLAPILLTAKKFHQSMWQRELDWDDLAPEMDIGQWKNITTGWENFQKQIPRRITGEIGAIYELCVFCDGSSQAYACAIYLRVTESTGKVHTHLIFGKSHLRPLRGLSIPQMEMMGVTIGYRALNFVEQQLRLAITRRIIWTDSTAVLGWIRSKKKQEVYMEHRLQKIRQPGFEYRHVSSEDNSADCATRGLRIEDFLDFDLWWHGPHWLVEGETCWPKGAVENIIIVNSNNQPEETDKIPEEQAINAIKEQAINAIDAEPTFISDNDYKRFHSLRKLQKTIVFVRRWRKIVEWRKFEKNRPTPPPNAEEFEQAMKILVKRAQKEMPPEKDQVQRLDLKLDVEGIYRCEGRLMKAPLKKGARKPIFLSRKSPLVKLVVLDAHEKHCHAKTGVTLAAVRDTFWIPQGTKTVMNILQKIMLHVSSIRCHTVSFTEDACVASRKNPSLEAF